MVLFTLGIGFDFGLCFLLEFPSERLKWKK